MYILGKLIPPTSDLYNLDSRNDVGDNKPESSSLNRECEHLSVINYDIENVEIEKYKLYFINRGVKDEESLHRFLMLWIQEHKKMIEHEAEDKIHRDALPFYEVAYRDYEDSCNKFFKNCKKIKESHSIEDDIKRTNPKYETNNKEYRLNCQRCVVAYEARRRGFDVIAKPHPDNCFDRIPIMDDLKNGWPSVFKGAKLICCFENTVEKMKQRVENTMLSLGDGARAIVAITLTKEIGHVFIAEVHHGNIMFLDPQNGSMDASSYFFNAEPDKTYIMRIDNLPFTENIEKCCDVADDV